MNRSEIAQEYRDLFTRNKEIEEEQNKNYTFYVIKDTKCIVNENHPQHRLYSKISDIMRESNLSMDFSYYATVTCLDYLTELDEEDDPYDSIHEYIDQEVFVYTSDLTSWLGENVYHTYYLTEALEEYGVKDGFQALQLAQYKAFEEIWSEIINLIVSEFEEQDEDE